MDMGEYSERPVEIQHLASTVDEVGTELHEKDHANALRYLILMDAQEAILLQDDEDHQVDLQDPAVTHHHRCIAYDRACAFMASPPLSTPTPRLDGISR
jgi:hypothetical protein